MKLHQISIDNFLFILLLLLTTFRKLMKSEIALFLTPERKLNYILPDSER